MNASRTNARTLPASLSKLVPTRLALHLVASLRGHRVDAAPGEPALDPGIAVALVACGLARPALAARGPDLLHQALELRRLVRLPRGDAGGKGNSRAVRDQVQLRSPSAARAAQCVIFRLVRALFFEAPAAERAARTLVPSMHHRSQSILPWRSRRMRSALAIRSKVPSRRHLLHRS